MASEAEIRRQLIGLIRSSTGDPSARVSGLSVLPGHAGLSYSFELTTHPNGGGEQGERLVLRLAPEGVRPSGPADVVKQARIMRSLAGTSVPVPPVRWLDDSPAVFGRPYFIVGFVSGDKLALGEREYSPAEQLQCARAAIATLADLHAVPWEPRCAAWGEPLTLEQEMRRLDALLDRDTLVPETTVGAAELRARLRATMPSAPHVGCVHGDFQWSNALFANGRINAVIDWELAQVGAVLIDLGWLLLFSDRASWVETSLVPTHIPPPEQLAAMYRDLVTWPVTDADVGWFRAFAGYRFGVITAFNLMLHRRGKRLDPTWEEIALSAPLLFAHGRELIG
jgi:aminoglycoside phosphotransferase (APT) family kinase protein